MKKIGLALGAGGAKGLAHIGVLQVFIEHKIPIHLLSGTSIGAIIAAAFAAGADPYLMDKLARNINNSFIVDVTVPRLGLLKGDKAMEIIRLLTHQKTFEQLDIPLAVVATDIERGEKVVFKEGNVAMAVRASISIPGIFKPVRIDGRLLVDGAVTERLPVSELKEMGADFTIGVDLKKWPSKRVEVRNIYEVIMQSIDVLENEASRQYLNMADFLICPDLASVGTMDFQKADECIEIGREATLAKIEELKERLLASGFQIGGG